MVLHWSPSRHARHNTRVLLLFALLTRGLMAVPGWGSEIQNIRISNDQITLYFDGHAVDASSFLLTGPHRIALDVKGVMPGNSNYTTGGIITAIREAPHGDSGVRVVFNLSRPVVITNGQLAEGGHTLTLHFKTVDDAQFTKVESQGQMHFLSPPADPPSPATASHRNKTTATLPTKAKGDSALPQIYGDDSSRPLVVIDAGHGGHDPGAIASDTGLREKDLTLKTALAIRDALLAQGRVRVALTREDDRFLILRDRFGIARRLGARLFISIHCDSAVSRDATGASVYTLSEVASDREAARLAARENKADIISGVDLGDQHPDISSILIDLTQRETMNTSAHFADLLGREAKNRMPIKGNFHRMASLMVLKAPDMPSVLFETGYISNPSDAKFLNSAAGRKRIADSVARAVAVHFATRMASR